MCKTPKTFVLEKGFSLGRCLGYVTVCTKMGALHGSRFYHSNDNQARLA